jgi:S-adenosylmethionine:tRNA ribosyltransferase-isomerase
MSSWTDKFVYPPYDYRLGDALVTNFQLPKTQPMMAACAFGGPDLVLEAYRQAVAMQYRFHVYGDAMLILR